MKTSRAFASAVPFAVVLSVAAVGCGSDPDAVDIVAPASSVAPDPTDGSSAGSTDVATTTTVPTEPATATLAPEVRRLWVGPDLVECVGVDLRTCLQVSRSADGELEYFYAAIEGFTHEPGTSYVIDVEVTTIVEPDADGLGSAYRLIDVVESSN